MDYEIFFRRVHLGTFVSPNTWICQFGCNGMQYYKILSILIDENKENDEVNIFPSSVVSIGKISDSTMIEIIYEGSKKFYEFQEINEYAAEGDNNIKRKFRFQKKSEWIEKINKKIGGLDDVVKEIIDQIHCFIISALSLGGDFQIGVKKSKGILITGKPGTGKTYLALCIAGI